MTSVWMTFLPSAIGRVFKGSYKCALKTSSYIHYRGRFMVYGDELLLLGSNVLWNRSKRNEKVRPSATLHYTCYCAISWKHRSPMSTFMIIHSIFSLYSEPAMTERYSSQTLFFICYVFAF